MKPCRRGHTEGRYADGHCIVCRRAYKLAQYHRDAEYRERQRTQKLVRYRENTALRERIQTREREKYRQCPERREQVRARGREKKYGLTPEDYADLLRKQDFACAICKTTEPGGKGVFVVDHCHTTNAVRGLLCNRCNLGLGHFQDSPDFLGEAIKYLGGQ